MKRVICIIATIFLCLMPLRAQESGAVQAGRVLTDVGKSVAYISSGVALSGVTMTAAAMIYNAQHPDGTGNAGEALGTVFSAILGVYGMAIGGIGVLLSLLFLTPGELLLHLNGGSSRRYDEDLLRGFGMNLDLGGGFSPSLYPRISAGYHFSKAFYLGAGTSYNINLDSSRSAVVALPVFATIRLNIGKTAVTPYWDLDCGVDVLNHCNFYLATSLGARYRLSKKQNALVVGTYSELSKSYSGNFMAGIKVGYSF